MSNYIVDAVRYADQDLKAVRMGLSQAGDLVESNETSVQEVVARIEAQDTVHVLLREDGLTRTGPRLKITRTATEARRSHWTTRRMSAWSCPTSSASSFA